MPVHSFACGLSLLLLANAACAFGQQAGDATAGRRLAEASCLQCHGSPTAKVKAAAFAAIAAMPSTTAQSLGVFLRTSHAAMPNLILSASERDDVIAYILSFRQ
jgi:mono/diheme cytochrome c family protein